MADERKRKRMESNRESARRSRVKKQLQLQQVISDIDRFKRQNSEIASKIDETQGRCFAVETEMDQVSAQKAELEQRLRHLLSVADEAEKKLSRSEDVSRLSVELPSSRSNNWSDFSRNRSGLSNGDGGGSGSWMDALDFDLDLSLSPWRSSWMAPSPLIASAATMSQT
uniref:BZIP domain-containing protein n=1 Tax=Kalanchoe fedtschenkoi TaxID=63787 RepID=A0A7N0UFL8_KALFE